MMFVHVNAADADLAEEWLRATPNRLFGGGAPVILSDEEDAPIAAGIARRHGLAHHAIPDAPDRPEALRLRPLLGPVGARVIWMSCGRTNATALASPESLTSGTRYSPPPRSTRPSWMRPWKRFTWPRKL